MTKNRETENDSRLPETCKDLYRGITCERVLCGKCMKIETMQTKSDSTLSFHSFRLQRQEFGTHNTHQVTFGLPVQKTLEPWIQYTYTQRKPGQTLEFYAGFRAVCPLLATIHRSISGTFK